MARFKAGDIVLGIKNPGEDYSLYEQGLINMVLVIEIPAKEPGGYVQVRSERDDPYHRVLRICVKEDRLVPYTTLSKAIYT